MKKLSIFFIQIFFSFNSFAQKIETIFLNPKDSTSNMYIAVVPENVSTHAFMFLIPGAFQTPQYVLQQTDLPLYAARQGILTIIPTFATGISSLGIDSLTQQSLNNILKLVVEKYKLNGKYFYIGGLSIGGTCAVKYAELAVQNNYPIKPQAVFGIDPPLDFERLYNSSIRIMRLSIKSKPNDEVPYMIGRIQQMMKGTPKTAVENFYKLSPYSYNDTTQSAIKNLINTPVTLIAEPDIEWWMKNRSYDYTDINITDEAAMINELQRLGNTNAILIITQNKGFREPGHIRHPHSWSIVDPVKLIQWLKAQK